MRYPQYDKTGALLGHYADEQKTRDGVVYTGNPIPDDHSDIVARDEQRKLDPGRKGKLERLQDLVATLQARIEVLEAKPATLKV